MKVYVGKRDKNGNCSVRVIEHGDSRALRARTDIANHSPTGFEWGYAGSGPAQLALALIADVGGFSKASVLRLHQRFKFRVVARLPREGWKLTADEVLAAIGAILIELDGKPVR